MPKLFLHHDDDFNELKHREKKAQVDGAITSLQALSIEAQMSDARGQS
jgi:hypothetical protein